MNYIDEILCGDCETILADIPEKTYQLAAMSPPYADSRKSTYGGVHPDEYVEWFLPKSKMFYRALRDDGTFLINIKEKVVEGERHTYVLDLIKALRKQGWLWTEEYIWHKRNCSPGKWPNRFRDAWERVLQFNKQRKFAMYQDEVMVPMGDWKKERFKKLGENDIKRHASEVGSGFGKNIANWKDRDMAYPTNVLHLHTECGNKGHSAAFPIDLPRWFIKLFTKEGDAVLDPFVGSGTTCAAARELKRHFTGIELNKKYFQQARERVFGEKSVNVDAMPQEVV